MIDELLQILNTVGQVVDTPWAAVRTGIRDRDIGSGLESILDVNRRATGREMLESLGMGENQPGLDWGDVAGFGAEVIPDMLLPGAGAYKALKWLRGAGDVADAAPAGRAWLDAIDKAVPTPAGPQAIPEEQLMRLIGGNPIIDAANEMPLALPHPNIPAQLADQMPLALPAPRPSAFEGRTFYHGTGQDFDQFSPDRTGGLIHFADEPYIAQSYAGAQGGHRRASRNPSDFWTVDDNGVVYDYDGAQWIPTARDLDGALPGNPQKLWPLTGEEAPIDAEDFVNELSGNVEGLQQIPKRSRVVKANLDIKNPLDLTTPEGIRTLGSLPIPEVKTRAEQVAANVIRNAQGGDFHWFDTKHEPRTRHWQQYLAPKLEDIGYDGIVFRDDGHRTYSAFRPDQVKRLASIMPLLALLNAFAPDES